MESRSVETTGADIDEAISKGLAGLALERDAVEVEVLDEPSRGVFGLGAREARVRVTAKAQPAATAAEAAVVEAAPAAPAAVEGEVSLDADAARATLLDLLARLGVSDAEVDATWTEPDPEDEEVSLLLTVRAAGDDLVGQRGETLDALQHITRLLVGHEQERYTRWCSWPTGWRSRPSIRGGAWRSSRCRRMSGAWSIWRCARIPTCTLRASARAIGARSRSSRATSGRARGAARRPAVAQS